MACLISEPVLSLFGSPKKSIRNSRFFISGMQQIEHTLLLAQATDKEQTR